MEVEEKKEKREELEEGEKEGELKKVRLVKV